MVRADADGTHQGAAVPRGFGVRQPLAILRPVACPILLREAELYRCATDADSRHAETPLENNDHALDGLRYLIASIEDRVAPDPPRQPNEGGVPLYLVD